MRKFKTSPFNIEVDLDDPNIYEYLPNSIKELRSLMYEEIGKSYCYMNFYHKDIYLKLKGCIEQKKRINKLIKHFIENENDHLTDVMWYKEEIFLFQNETENMC